MFHLLGKGEVLLLIIANEHPEKVQGNEANSSLQIKIFCSRGCSKNNVFADGLTNLLNDALPPKPLKRSHA